MEQATATTDSDKLLLTKKWAAWMEKKSEKASSSHGSDGKRVARLLRRRRRRSTPTPAGAKGRRAIGVKECPNRKQEKKVEAHLA